MDDKYKFNFDEELIVKYLDFNWCKGYYTNNGEVVGGSIFKEVAEANHRPINEIELSNHERRLFKTSNYSTHYTAKGNEDRKYKRRQLSVMRSPQSFWVKAGFDNSVVGAPSWSLFKNRNLTFDEWGEVYKFELSKIGIINLLEEYGANTILYCCEKDPKDCHRSFLGEFLSLHIDKDINEINAPTNFQFDLPF